MGWLTDNSLANMPGPDFLVFYAIVAAIAALCAYIFIDLQDASGSSAPPATPSVIDPYELAYLRGGVNEVIRAAVYALRQKKLIVIAAKGRLQASAAGPPPPLPPIERRVFETIAPELKIPALFKDRALRGAMESLTAAAARRLSAQRLLQPPEVRRAGILALALGSLLLLALAGYKIAVALAHGHSNIGFLCIGAVAACFVLYGIFAKKAAGAASKRGKAYLAQVQLAYSGRARAAFSGAAVDSAGQAALGGSALLMVGLFGFAILKDTPDAALAQEFSRATSSDGGGGCGGGDGGGGGGCGGCGGGD